MSLLWSPIYLPLLPRSRFWRTLCSHERTTATLHVPAMLRALGVCGRPPAAARGESQGQGHQTSCTVQGGGNRNGQVHAFKRLRWRKDFAKVSDYVRVQEVGGETLYPLGKRARQWDRCSDRTSGLEDGFPSHPPQPSKALTSSTEEEKRSRAFPLAPVAEL